ncbi:MAG TPA: glycosyltransferase [Polyangiaceae bacterium]|nr:glycosyltransferase [Polyangiaceae bacterium]
MKIAYVFDRPLPARQTDSEQALQTIAALSRRGAHVSLVLPAQRTAPSARELAAHYQVSGDFEVVYAPTPFRDFELGRKWWHALRAIELPAVAAADLVYTRNFPTLFALGRGRRPFAYETYRPWSDQFPVLAPFFRRAMASPFFLGAVLHSHFARDRYAALGVDEQRLLVAHNGHDPSRFVSPPPRSELRAALGLPLDRKVVVYTGHVNLTKGLDTVLRMARQLPDVAFVLVGSDGRGVIESLAARTSNVSVVPWQPFDSVARYLLAADVLLQPPSRVPLKLIGNTVLPMKLFLYLAAGRPIVAPDLPDMREVLRHDHNALLVPTGDDDAASLAVARVIGEPGLAERLSQGARETAAGLTWDARAARILSFLETRRSALAGSSAFDARNGSARRGEVCQSPGDAS